MDNKKELDLKFYTLKEVSELIDVTTRTLQNYIKDGRLEANKIGGKWIITEENLKRLIQGK